MAAFFDLRDLAKIDKKRKLWLGCWLIAVTALTLLMFFLKYLDLEYPAYVICIVVSLAVFAAELVCIFRASGCRVTPLLLFLVAFYLTRNSQLLLILFGIRFDVHHLILLQQQLKDGIVLVSAGNIWAGFAGLLVAVPKGEMCRELHEWTKASPARMRFLAIGCAVTGAAAYASAGFAIANRQGAALQFPQPLTFVAFLFLPFGFALLAGYPKQKRGAAAALALAVYFLLSVFWLEQSDGVAGLFVLAVFFCFLWETPGKRSHNAAALVSVLLLLGVLSGLAAYLRDPALYAGKTAGAVVVDWISDLGRGFLSLLVVISIVPVSEAALLGREYAASLLAGVLPPEVDPTGTISRLTADTRVWRLWDETYLQSFPELIGFSPDAEGYMNVTWFGFVAVFLICLLVAFLLDRYRWYGRGCAFPRFVACVMLWAALTLPGRSSAHLVQMFVWGVLFVGCIGGRPRGAAPNHA